MIEKPLSVESSAFKSAKWDEITHGREFHKSQVPTLEILCHWYEVAERCMEDMSMGGAVQVAYSNAMDDIKALPQVSVLKQATDEIRALSKQLGIDDKPLAKSAEKQESKLYVIANRRASRAARAADQDRTG